MDIHIYIHQDEEPSKKEPEVPQGKMVVDSAYHLDLIERSRTVSKLQNAHQNIAEAVWPYLWNELRNLYWCEPEKPYGNLIPTIKRVRELFPEAGLRSAKDFVEDYIKPFPVKGLDEYQMPSVDCLSRLYY